VTVSDLAEAAGVARGTVYNNLDSVESLFEDVASALTTEMGSRVAASSETTVDPARRLADGVRFFVRRAHEDPQWGRFIVRFGGTASTLRLMLESAATDDLRLGVELERFQVRADQIPTAVAVLSGAVLAAMGLVLEGHRTWRDAGSDAAELMLRALGVSADEARALATSELPPLASRTG